ncbi:hypothetical protein FOXG_10814 [Fusarium oxysporum f. sp. lycopersici 4287]|uniref:Uncharacterized protein n=2 Tax=Fusarium oxysporum TaxID=5507 RepID=A0A0J9WQF0_FUSO4|nr:hypothetical protein FOXG_10814 [Fusarium oxysporum f. sp. lycopersici 4287]KNB10667.1 hypothetical protein FOXG_10814 [Fusarium oxysporum f. sp. lycopersici 4287]
MGEQQCTGFIATREEIEQARGGLPNAIWFSGDTSYIKELKQISYQYGPEVGQFGLIMALRSWRP